MPLAASGKIWNRFNHTSLVVVATPTDCPKLICNGCVIEVFGGVCVVTLPFL